MRPALERAGIRSDFRPLHDLRGTSLTFSGAVNPGYVVKAQAGHGSMAVTDRYVRLARPLMLGVAERAERLLFAEVPARSVQDGCRNPDSERGPLDEEGPAVQGLSE